MRKLLKYAFVVYNMLVLLGKEVGKIERTENIEKKEKEESKR